MWRKILNFLNIPAHIKKMYMNWKIKKIKKGQNQSPLLIILNIFLYTIILSGAGFIIYIYRTELLGFYEQYTNIIWASGAGLVLLLAILLAVKYSNNKSAATNNQISKIILKDEDNTNIRDWNMTDKTALLVGKKTPGNDVDIDLSNCTYAQLVSREHGVINNTGENWYFEDIGSENGSGIRRRGASQKSRVEAGSPCLLNQGDIIYIANTKLLLQ